VSSPIRSRNLCLGRSRRLWATLLLPFQAPPRLFRHLQAQRGSAQSPALPTPRAASPQTAGESETPPRHPSWRWNRWNQHALALTPLGSHRAIMLLGCGAVGPTRVRVRGPTPLLPIAKTTLQQRRPSHHASPPWTGHTQCPANLRETPTPGISRTRQLKFSSAPGHEPVRRPEKPASPPSPPTKPVQAAPRP
jgi:hypothetical protein